MNAATKRALELLSEDVLLEAAQGVLSRKVDRCRDTYRHVLDNPPEPPGGANRLSDEALLKFGQDLVERVNISRNNFAVALKELRLVTPATETVEVPR